MIKNDFFDSPQNLQLIILKLNCTLQNEKKLIQKKDWLFFKKTSKQNSLIETFNIERVSTIFYLNRNLPFFKTSEVLHDDGHDPFGPRLRVVCHTSAAQEVFYQRRKQIRVQVGLIKNHLKLFKMQLKIVLLINNINKL